jgi:hypothetical protein
MPNEILLGGLNKSLLNCTDEKGLLHTNFDLYITNLRIMNCRDTYLESTINVWNVTKNITRETQDLSIDEKFKIIEKLEKRCYYQINKSDISDINIVKRRGGLFNKFLVADVLIKLRAGKEVKYWIPHHSVQVFVDSVMRFFPEVKITEPIS